MNYKQALAASMAEISKDKKIVHIGYGLKYGGRGAGSLKDVPDSQIIETPVAENLMLGLAIGLAFENYVPVVYYERFDFIMNAMDALVNHLDKIKDISNNEFNPKVIIRCVVGGKKKPFFTGPTHTQNFEEPLRMILKNVNIFSPKTPKEVTDAFMVAVNSGVSSIVIEEKDLYEVV